MRSRSCSRPDVAFERSANRRNAKTRVGTRVFLSRTNTDDENTRASIAFQRELPTQSRGSTNGSYLRRMRYFPHWRYSRRRVGEDSSQPRCKVRQRQTMTYPFIKREYRAPVPSILHRKYDLAKATIRYFRQIAFALNISKRWTRVPFSSRIRILGNLRRAARFHGKRNVNSTIFLQM